MAAQARRPARGSWCAGGRQRRARRPRAPSRRASSRRRDERRGRRSVMRHALARGGRRSSSRRSSKPRRSSASTVRLALGQRHAEALGELLDGDLARRSRSSASSALIWVIERSSSSSRREERAARALHEVAPEAPSICSARTAGFASRAVACSAQVFAGEVVASTVTARHSAGGRAGHRPTPGSPRRVAVAPRGARAAAGRSGRWRAAGPTANVGGGDRRRPRRARRSALARRRP